jgi:hypothetical protein
VFASGSVSAYGAALIAGLSAIVGGAITAGSNLLVEARRRKHDVESLATREQRDLRQATRLVLAELAEVDQAIRHSARSHLTWPLERQLPGFAWKEYRGTLAVHLPLHAWRWVESAYDEANGLNWRVIEFAREASTEGPVHRADVEWLRAPFRTIRHAMGELEQALGEPRGAFGYTGYASIDELEADAFGDSAPSEREAEAAEH